jgi:uncharacterized membrane protein
MTVVVSKSVSSDGDAKSHALVSYVLMGIGLFTAIPIIIGAVWAMFTRGNARGTVYHSHYTNAIRVFWWSLFWTVIGFILVFVLVGYAILGIVWLWALYRLVYGFAKLLSDEPFPL